MRQKNKIESFFFQRCIKVQKYKEIATFKCAGKKENKNVYHVDDCGKQFKGTNHLH